MSDTALRLEVLDQLGHINIRGNTADEAFVAAVEAATGLPLPRRPNTVAGSDARIFWLGPDEWLLVTGGERVPAQLSALREALQGQHAAVNDQSGGQLLLRLSGTSARELLAAGCTLDLHVGKFRTGDCAQTGLARASVILCPSSDGTAIDIIVRRSFADYLLQWLRRAGRDHGIEFA